MRGFSKPRPGPSISDEYWPPGAIVDLYPLPRVGRAALSLSLAILLLALLRAVAPAQQIGQNAPATTTATSTIRVSTQLVIETVVVKDKKGNPVEGLTAKDFAVTENGVAQAISFCEHQELPASPAPRRRPNPGRKT